MSDSNVCTTYMQCIGIILVNNFILQFIAFHLPIVSLLPRVHDGPQAFKVLQQQMHTLPTGPSCFIAQQILQ